MDGVHQRWGVKPPAHQAARPGELTRLDIGYDAPAYATCPPRAIRYSYHREWHLRPVSMSPAGDTIRRMLAYFPFDALFNTYTFLFLFLPITLAGYWLLPRGQARWLWIGGASLVFYSFWDWRFTALLVASSVVDFVVAKRIVQARSVAAAADQPQDGPGSRARRWLLASIVFNLGVLAFFKYAMWGTENLQSVLSLLGSNVVLPIPHIVLPVGISFYTFQTLSYTVDVYRGHVTPTSAWPRYLAYVTLFPQLVAGPIVRYAQVTNDFDDLPARLPAERWSRGIFLLAVGLCKKVVIADTLATGVDPLWARAAAETTATATAASSVGLDTLSAWLAVLGYSLQLYFDFSGYSDMALGLGCLLGFTYPINFDAPYQARDPADFWRRWHMTLGAFLRDYLYKPLGGNRLGPSRTLVNLSIVMLLGGLWHGAAWTFVAWGGYHGILLVVHRLLREPWGALPVAGQRALTLFLVILGWVPFRAPDFATAAHVLQAMFVPNGADWSLLAHPVTAMLLAALAITQLARPAIRVASHPTWRHAVWTSLCLVAAILLMGAAESPFLYYQF